jgi:hypothetical protein
MRPPKNIDVLFVAGFGPVVRDPAASCGFYCEALGLLSRFVDPTFARGPLICMFMAGATNSNKGGLAMSEADFIKVTCGCGKSFKAPATAVGKKARCPSCSAIMVIAAGAAVRLAGAAAPGQASAGRRSPAVAGQSRAVSRPQPAIEPAGAEDAVDAQNSLDALDELARQAEAAPALPDVARCNQCAMPMPQGGVLCIHCGYDTRTGKKLAVAVAAAPAKPAAFTAGGRKGKPTIDRMAPNGSFAAGMVVSLLFAVGASVVWIALAYATGITIGYVAILIGGAAGVGMQIGHKGYSRAGGYGAAALTFVAILLAKLIVLEMLLSRAGSHRSIADLDPAKLGYYLFGPIGLIIIVIGMAAAFRTANGSITD